jgi:hypothetical protein
MKRLLFLGFLTLFISSVARCQVFNDFFIGKDLSVGRGNKYPDPTNTILEIGDTAIKKAMILPRVIHRDSIGFPQFGMFIYDMSDSSAYVRRRYSWQKIDATPILNGAPILKSLAELRAMPNSRIDTSVGYRLRVGKRTREYYLDPNDVSSPDDSVMTVVTTGGKRLKMQTDGIVYVRDFGATPNDFSDDDAIAFNKMFRWVEKQGNITYRIILDEGRYKIKTSIILPDSNSLLVKGHTYLTIEGNGTSILTDSNIVMFDRRPKHDLNTVLNYYIEHYAFVIRGIDFFGDGTMTQNNQVAINIGGSYQTIIEQCHFRYFDTAIVLRFALSPTIRDCNFQGIRDVAIFGGTGNWPGSTICNSGFNAALITKNRFNNYAGQIAPIMLDNPIGTNIYDNISEGVNPVYHVWMSGKNSSCQTDNFIEKLWVESGGGPTLKSTVVYWEGRNNLYLKNLDIHGSDHYILDCSNALLATQNGRITFDGLRSSGIDTAFITGGTLAGTTEFSFKNIQIGVGVYDYLFTPSVWGGTIPYHVTVEGYDNIANQKVYGSANNILFETGKLAPGGLGSVSFNARVFSKIDNTPEFGGQYGSLNRRFGAIYAGTFGMAVDHAGGYWFGNPANISSFDTRIKRDSARQISILDNGSNLGGLKASWGNFTTRAGYTSNIAISSLNDDDFVTKRHLSNAGAFVKDAFTLATDGTRSADAVTLVTYILVKPVSALSAFKVGLTNGGEELIDASPCSAGEWTTFQVNYFLETSATIYIAGVTSSTDIKIIKAPL